LAAFRKRGAFVPPPALGRGRLGRPERPVRSIEAVFARLQRAGWQGFSEPVTFTVPPYRVSEVMVVGPDG
jgi:hypothetical protein